MRVCFVSREVGGISGGGIGIYIVEAARALTAHGHEVWLVTEDPGTEKRGRLLSLPMFHRVCLVGENVPAERRQRVFHGEPHYGYSMLVHETLLATGATFDYIEFPDYQAEGLIPFREQKLFGTYGATVLGVMLHSPTYECFLFDQQMHRATQPIREVCLLEDAAIRSAPLLTAPSRGLLELVTTRLNIATTGDDIVRYPMKVPDTVAAPVRPRRSLQELTFLYFGRIEPRKGITELLEAFRRLPQLSITLVGGDVPYSPYGRSYREHLERQAPPNVRFAGVVPRETMLEMIDASDVCILPSLFENWPNACIEAMAAGRVVLGSKHGGMAEMIEDGESGFLVDGRDPADIVRTITERLAGALSRLDEIGANAAARIRSFSEQATYVRAVERRVSAKRAALAAVVPPPRRESKVSIVIPFFKDRDTIDDAVASACAQTHRHLEILVVNDGSPLDDAAVILQRQQARDPRIRVLEKPNGGLSSARNFGVRHATGEYVLFLDADNLLRPDYAATAVAALDDRPELSFVTPHVRFFEDGSGVEYGIYNPIPFDRTIGLLINRFGDAGATFRRTVFSERGFAYDELLIAYEDWALWMDLHRAGLQGEVIPRVLYDYRVRKDSMVRLDGAPNHAALMGLLIQRHFPVVDQQEAALLTTLFQVAGGAIIAIMGGSSDHERRHWQRVSAPEPPGRWDPIGWTERAVSAARRLRARLRILS